MDSRIPSLELSKKTQCVHTRSIRNLVSLQDLGENKFLSSHIEKCQTCKKAVGKLTLKLEQLKVLVPRPHIDLKTKNVFEQEVGEIFNTLRSNEKKLKSMRFRSNLKTIDNSFVAFIKNLSSKTMLKTYGLALVLFVVLKQILN